MEITLVKKTIVVAKDKLKKVFIVGGGTNYANWLPNVELTTNYKESNVVLFTGGEDISPSIYGEKRHKRTSNNPRRDEEEFKVAKQAVNDGKYLLGICRGAQLLCVLAGGKLIQHQENSHPLHSISTTTGYKDIMMSSYHHQAMYPYNLHHDSYNVLGYTQKMCKYHLNGNNQEMNPFMEVEVCYFSKIKALGIQGHPEMLWRYKEDFGTTFEYLNQLFSLLLTDSL